MAWSNPRTWVTGEVVTAAHMNQEVRDNLVAGFPAAVSSSSWTPALVGGTSGSLAAQSGRQWRVGPIQFVWVRYVFTGPGEVTGNFTVTLPVAVSGLTSAAVSGQTIGVGHLMDATAAPVRQSASVIIATSTTVRFVPSTGGSVVTDSIPFTWTTDDVLSFQATYPVA